MVRPNFPRRNLTAVDPLHERRARYAEQVGGHRGGQFSGHRRHGETSPFGNGIQHVHDELTELGRNLHDVGAAHPDIEHRRMLRRRSGVDALNSRAGYARLLGSRDDGMCGTSRCSHDLSFTNHGTWCQLQLQPPQEFSPGVPDRRRQRRRAGCGPHVGSPLSTVPPRTLHRSSAWTRTGSWGACARCRTTAEIYRFDTLRSTFLTSRDRRV